MFIIEKKTKNFTFSAKILANKYYESYGDTVLEILSKWKYWLNQSVKVELNQICMIFKTSDD
jgi:hypothetical protein